MNSVCPLAETSWTMPGTLAARVGPHRNHVAALAHRHDRVLNGRGVFAAVDHGIESFSQAALRDPRFPAEPAELLARGIENIAPWPRQSGRASFRAQSGSRAPRQTRRAGETLVSVLAGVEAFAGMSGRVKRVGDQQQVGRLQAGALLRAFDLGADVPGAADRSNPVGP